MKNEIQEIIKLITDFNNERNWDKFHNIKDVALAISIEAGELNELFLWKQPDEIDIEKAKLELADVLIYAFLMAKKLNVNIYDIVAEKIHINADKYPVNKSFNNNKKYNEL